MQREIKNLQDAVNSIHISETMQAEIIRNVKADTGKRRRFPRAAVAALAVLLLGMVSIPGRAVVQSFLQARVEDMSEEDRTVMVDNLQSAEADIDTQTRAYTEEEKRKFDELAAEYKEGRFPKGELAQVETAEEAEKLGFCFLIPVSRFYLPDRELTEEEMLQIIDFHVKRNYALRQYAEEKHPDWFVEDPQQAQERRKEEILENGGISEETAREIAKEWLLKIYGDDADGLECQSLLSESVPIGDKMVFFRVIYAGIAYQPYYSFHIDIQDGSLAAAGRYDESGEEAPPDTGEADALLPELARNAVSFAEEQMGLTYQDVYYAYYTVNGTLYPTVTFYFVEEDGSAFVLEYYWSGAFCRFQKYLFPSYQEEYETIRKTAEARAQYGSRGGEIRVELFFEKMEEMEEYP